MALVNEAADNEQPGRIFVQVIQDVSGLTWAYFHDRETGDFERWFTEDQVTWEPADGVDRSG